MQAAKRAVGWAVDWVVGPAVPTVGAMERVEGRYTLIGSQMLSATGFVGWVALGEVVLAIKRAPLCAGIHGTQTANARDA